ncbi:bacillithiol biosynthesis cysteine-adding enzyme BshC [Gracilibacillus caseinilyticus]|uniref:Putative cysteine ligase BshC n=1 Tax=Gracilibacillus caseinilyticus TaxID=2932256 RepID=A0ABY4EUR8_9BACI|nr:bacillithiol biosynthesis cysteine-adding enzyme BshC [Gracilibacillus caseinilyticus]UOQ47968.1 bacillithiol biosynthesis cysteine-adding enzyme BshC [Gracilibacillus caseinilyticus]
MRIESHRLDFQNKFLSDYQNGVEGLLDHFDYDPYDNDVYEQRLADLNERSFQRDVLSDLLKDMNQAWSASALTSQNIEKLKNPESVVVIGGQQAGILTGPLYTINKIISILSFAKEQEKRLNVPVLPVFWIAGEDHDFDEVNHIFLPEATKLHKFPITNPLKEKVSVSNRTLDKETARAWLRTTFRALRETAYTKKLFQNLEHKIEQSLTFVDFFASFIHELFEDTGIILIDSGNPKLRKLEIPYFQTIINNQKNISQHAYHSLQSMRTKGYHVSVDTGEQDAHLFIEEHGDRVLLQKAGDDIWVGKNGECRYSTEQLLHIAEKEPERLSNNVVTRPLMQEMLFPTLAFFAGPSEAAYWSLLKNAFHSISLTMPPVLPRVSLTLIEERVEKLLAKYNIATTAAINGRVHSYKQNWLAAQQQVPIGEMTEQLKQMISQGHQPIQGAAKALSDDVQQYAEKNKQLLLNRVDELTNRLNQELSKKYQFSLQEFDYIQLHLKPEGGLQERMWNIIYFINQNGSDWLREINHYPFDWKEQHYIVYV